MSSNKTQEKSYKVTDSQLAYADQRLSALQLKREDHMVIAECLKSLTVNELEITKKLDK